MIRPLISAQIVVAMTLSVIVWGGVDASGQTLIPTDADAMTTRDYGAIKREHVQREIVDVFRGRTTGSEPWFEDASRAIDGYLLMASEDPNAPLASDVKRAAKKATEAGCDDGMVLYLAAYGPAQWRTLEDRIQPTIAALKSQAYGPYPVMIALRRFSYEAHRFEQADLALELREEALEYAYRVMALSRPNEDESRAKFENINLLTSRTYLPIETLLEFRDRLEELAGADPWLTKVVIGRIGIEVAWEKRGTGFANTVTDEGWEGFNWNLKEAYRLLSTAHQESPQHPEAAAMLITVAKGGVSGDDEGIWYWFEQAVKAQMDWRPAYTVLLDAIQPKWGGSFDTMLEFANECAATKRYDTDVPLFALDIVLNISDTLNNRILLEQPDTFDLLLPVLLEAARRPPTPRRDSFEYYTSLAVGLGWLANRQTEVEPLAASLDYRLASDSRELLHLEYLPARSEIGPYGRPVGDQLRAIDAALEKAWDAIYKDGDDQFFQNAAELARAALEAHQNADHSSEHAPYTVQDEVALRDRVIMAQSVLDYMDGNWIELALTEGFPGWETIAGSWSIENDGEALGKPSRRRGNRSSGLMLVFDVPIGSRVEVQGSFVCEEAKQPERLNAGIMLGLNTGFPSGDYHMIRFYPELNEVRVSQRRFEPVSYPAEVGNEGAFLIQYWDGVASVWLDDQWVFTAALPLTGRDWNPGAQIGFGGHYWFRDNGVRFRNLKIRRLDSPPTEIDRVLRESH